MNISCKRVQVFYPIGRHSQKGELLFTVNAVFELKILVIETWFKRVKQDWQLVTSIDSVY